MNRLVIIGNGFDLAHDLPTGYGQFIDWYWSNIFMHFTQLEERTFDDDLISIKLLFKTSSIKMAEAKFKDISTFRQFREFISSFSEAYNPIFPEDAFNRCSLKFNNVFFETICDKKSIQNWVDIENEYYKLLKKCLEEDSNEKVKKLNQEFEQVKNLLEEYLQKNIAEKYDFNIPNEEYGKILKLFSVEPLYLKDNPNHDYFKEFSRQDYKCLIDFDEQLVVSYKDRNLQTDIDNGKITQKNLILNFNYTPLLDKYIVATRNRNFLSRKIAFGETWQIQIHGKLLDDSNKINFGFGDEMDDDYKLLERKDDNEYLKNIKSFLYLQNSNYKDMLDFIESDKFQVYLLGHSCGLSDRILLNTIFEHNNCRSIKVFYHEKNERNNYTDIVQNISRHFNKKNTMRDKIVNKSLCQPLPQNVRFDKKG
jgi:Bacteriophage abortive infection AbiH